MRLIAHLSDLHFGSHDPAVVRDLLQDLGRLQPDLVVVSGDLTQRARRWEFTQARRFLDQLPAPTLCIPGNHDIPLFNPLRRFLDPRRRYRRYIAANCEPFFQDAEMSVLGLDTSRSNTWKEGRVSHEQAARLEQAFAGAENRLRVLVTHHPLIAARDAPTQGIVGRSSMALAAADRTAIDLLLSGHHHHSSSEHSPIFRSGPGRSILVVHAGTATSTRQRGEVNSYNVIAMEGRSVTCSVREWQGGTFVLAMQRAYDRDGAGWLAQSPPA